MNQNAVATREAKIFFMLENKELWDAPEKLAIKMQHENIYSRFTTRSDIIRRFIPTLIKEALARERNHNEESSFCSH